MHLLSDAFNPLAILLLVRPRRSLLISPEEESGGLGGEEGCDEGGWTQVHSI